MPRLTLLSLPLAFFTVSAFAAPGDLDSGFGNGGIVTAGVGMHNDHAGSVAVQSDGKIIVAAHNHPIAAGKADRILDFSRIPGGRWIVI